MCGMCGNDVTAYTGYFLYIGREQQCRNAITGGSYGDFSADGRNGRPNIPDRYGHRASVTLRPRDAAAAHDAMDEASHASQRPT